MYIVQPSRLAACRLACAQCRAWHETPRAAYAKQKKLNSLDQAGGVSHDGVKVVGAVVVDKAEGDLDAPGSMKSNREVRGVRTAREVVGVMVLRELGK